MTALDRIEADATNAAKAAESYRLLGKTSEAYRALGIAEGLRAAAGYLRGARLTANRSVEEARAMVAQITAFETARGEGDAWELLCALRDILRAQINDAAA